MKDINNIELHIGDFVQPINDDCIGEIIAIVSENVSHPDYTDLLSKELVEKPGMNDGVYLRTFSLGLIYLEKEQTGLKFKLIIRDENFSRQIEIMWKNIQEMSKLNQSLRAENLELSTKLSQYFPKS
jgi:hypothetical protein